MNMGVKVTHPPVIDEPIDALLPQLPPGLVVVVVVSPAEDHQAFGLGLFDVVEVLQELLGVSADALEEQAPLFRKNHRSEARHKTPAAHQDVLALCEADGDFSVLTANVHQLGVFV